MLSKLRRRFTLDTMVLTLIVLIGSTALLIVASYTYSRNNANDTMLGLLNEVNSGTVLQNEGDEEMPLRLNWEKIDQKDDVAVILLSEKGELLDFETSDRSFGETIEEDLEAISRYVDSAEKDSGVVPARQVRFMKQPLKGVGTKAALMDRTSETEAIYFQFRVYIGLAFIILILILILCDYLARRAILPVDEAIRTQQQFIADASHELKTPLTVILANLDIIASNKDLTVREAERWLDNTKSETKRMSKLVNEMLFLARSDAAMDMHYNFRLIDFGEAIDEVVLTTEALAFERNITLESDIAPDALVVGDFERLKQVVMILVENATKYVDEGGRIDVKLTAVSRRNCLLTVTNTGEPIPPDKSAHIFDRFYRVDESRVREKGGYGLGLSIAQNIVEKHNGEIKLNYSNESGTCFSVRLPHAQSMRAPDLSVLPDQEASK